MSRRKSKINSLINTLFFLVGLSIGVIFNNKPIQGSCGGIGADESCTICGGDTEKCDSLEGV